MSPRHQFESRRVPLGAIAAWCQVYDEEGWDIPFILPDPENPRVLVVVLRKTVQEF